MSGDKLSLTIKNELRVITVQKEEVKNLKQKQKIHLQHLRRNSLYFTVYVSPPKPLQSPMKTSKIRIREEHAKLEIYRKAVGVKSCSSSYFLTNHVILVVLSGKKIKMKAKITTAISMKKTKNTSSWNGTLFPHK